jgi:lipoprotein-anchoring transpeptidase ErfK/SrfK/flagellar basal body-associated protein FliL
MSSANEDVAPRRRSKRNKKSKKSVETIINNVKDTEKTSDEVDAEVNDVEDISTQTEETTDDEFVSTKEDEEYIDEDSGEDDEETDDEEYDGDEDEYEEDDEDDEDDEEEYEPPAKSKNQPELKNKMKNKNHKKSGAVVTAILAVFVVLVLAAVVSGHIYFKDKWYFNTTLNDMDVSAEELSQTKQKLDETYNNYSLTIRGRDEMVSTVLKDDIDLEVDAEKYIDEAFNKQHETFYIFAFFSPQELVMEPDVSYSEEKLADVLDKSEIVAGSASHSIIAPVNALAKFSDEKGYFMVQPEVEGNKVQTEKLDEAVKNAISILASEINLEDYDDMFYAPEIRQDDENLVKTCEAYNSVALHWITWKLTDSVKISLTPQDVKAWYDLDENYNATLNQQAVQDWVENFCLKYKSVGKTRNFKTHTGSVVQVSGGDYGWQMDYDATVKQVTDILNADNSAAIDAYLKDNSEENKKPLVHDLDASFKNKGYKFDPNNITDDVNLQNYSEISIDEQMVYVYQNGECVYTAHCITGLPTPERETTKGTWYIKERKRNKTLVGETYSTPVSYWVRITWSGIGYHDATWQSWGSWNASKYKTVGSHGCVNLSMTDVAKIYDLVRVGDPVFIY